MAERAARDQRVGGGIDVKKWAAYFVRGELHAKMAATSIASLPKGVVPIVMTDEPTSRILDFLPDDMVFWFDSANAPIMLANLEAQCQVLSLVKTGDRVAFLDTDIIVQGDALWQVARDEHLFVTWREKLVENPDEYAQMLASRMPYNYGVIVAMASYSAQQAFTYMRERVRVMSDRLQSWYGNQVALSALAGVKPGTDEIVVDDRRIAWTPTSMGCRISIAKGPCSTWNYTPQTPDEDITGKHVLHFKGVKRNLMGVYAQRLGLPWTIKEKVAA